MRVLFLTQILPYPPDAGPRVKTWHVLRYLVERGHRVTLASFVRPEEQEHLPFLEKMLHAVHAVPIRRSRLADAAYFLRSNLSGRPFLVERDDLPPMRSLVDRLVREEQIEVIHADQLSMAQFALPYQGKGPRLVFDAHNAVWTIVRRMAENAPAPARPLAALETGRVKRYEGELLCRFDHTLAVAEPDRLALLQAVETYQKASRNGAPSPQIHVVPIAVDTRELQPAARRPGSRNIVTLGTLHYPPNADGIRWFLREVFPLVQAQVPAATLTIIGKNPPADFRQLAARQPESIRVTGYVDELGPYMDQAALMVVPVRAGGGMRVRILEAFARAMPVVTTTVGLEGIEARHGEEVLVADSSQDFAGEVTHLLQDEGLQARLAEKGRRLAADCYDWQVVLNKMDEIYSPSRPPSEAAGSAKG